VRHSVVEFAVVCCSGNVEMLRMQVSVRSDNVARRDRQVGKCSRDTNRIQDRSWILPEKWSVFSLRWACIQWEHVSM